MSELPEFFGLDAESGPAKIISDAQGAQLISNALDQWSLESRPQRSSQAWLKAAAYAFALIMGTSSGSIAAWMYFSPPVGPESTPKQALAPIKVAPTIIEVKPTIEDIKETQAPAEVLEAAPKPSVKPRRVYKSKKVRAEDFLKQANALRRGQDWQRAARAYALVAQKFEGSDSEYVALVSEAEIQFEQLQDFPRALFCYRQALALRPNGVLEAEILYGLSRVYEVSGESEKEKQILEKLSRDHPHSPFASLARSRLEISQ
jgi:tetratricopeptide (TPR) repeat protein